VSITVNQSFGWIFLVLLGGGVVWAARVYRRVPPTIGRGLRAGLVTLRAAALACLVLALLEPVLGLSRTIRERPIVAVLFDASRSMAVPDGTSGAARGDEAFSLLNEFVLPRIARDAEVRAYEFADGLAKLDVSGRAVTKEPAFEGDATDIGAAFASLRSELSGRNLAAVVVATDGANNKGASPYDAGAALGVPVFVLGVGSTEPAVDIAIKDVTTNRISYVGESLPIEVRMTSAGFAGAETAAELSEDGKVLDSRTVSLSGSGEETVLTFKVVPSTPGVHRYTVSVPAAAGELTTANNTRVVATTVFKGKVRVLLLGSRPSWDFAFLKREFEADRNVEVTGVAVKEGAVVRAAERVPGSVQELLAYDLVALVEPDLAAPTVPPSWLARFVRERGGGLLVIGFPMGAASGAGELASILPASPPVTGATSEAETRVRLTDTGEAAASTRVVSDRFQNIEVWKSLPPVWVSAAPFAPRADAQVLIETAAQSGAGAPVAVVGRSGAGAVMMVLARDIWRWKMAGPEDVDVYGRLVANATRWLTARGELERLAVTTDKDVYVAGERAGFSAQAYREDYRIASGASITVAASRGEGAAPVGSITLRPEGDHYRGELDPLAPGRYVYRARAMLGGEDVGTASGEFTVEAFSLEDAETRQRPSVLTRLAEASGGSYYAPETVEDVPETVTFEWTKRAASREFELWNSPWLLSAFVGLLSLEWTLRRRKGLP
jgi:hypothetical protein